MSSSFYRRAGVNLEVGDEFSSIAGEVCRSSFDNSPYIRVLVPEQSSFRGPRSFQFVNVPLDWTFDLCPDGAGTKPVFCDALIGALRKPELVRWAAADWWQMCVADVLRWGGLPVLVVNQLDVRSLGDPKGSEDERLRNAIFCQMMAGLGQIAREEEVVLYRGETAEMGLCVGSDNPDPFAPFLWSGAALGLYDPSRMIVGENLEPGMVVIALREFGFGANGLSAARKAFSMMFGEGWHSNSHAINMIGQAAEPCSSYSSYLKDLNGWGKRGRVPVCLISHLTGGGIVDKFYRDMLRPRGLSAVLDDLWAPPPIMRSCLDWSEGQMTEEEAYQSFNGGQRMLLTVRPIDVEDCLRRAGHFNVHAKVCGKITQEAQPTLRIQSGYSRKILEWD